MMCEELRDELHLRRTRDGVARGVLDDDDSRSCRRPFAHNVAEQCGIERMHFGGPDRRARIGPRKPAARSTPESAITLDRRRSLEARQRIERGCMNEVAVDA